MKGREFFNKVTNDKNDFLAQFFKFLNERNIKFCIVGGLAVNAYAEPVISLDVDVVVASEQIDELVSVLSSKFCVNKYPHSINIFNSVSEIRIQIQTNTRYQDFIPRSSEKNILGYEVPVASLKDVLMSKIWAYLDTMRRESKRQKDLADIIRLIESHPELASLLPNEIKNKLGS